MGNHAAEKARSLLYRMVDFEAPSLLLVQEGSDLMRRRVSVTRAQRLSGYDDGGVWVNGAPMR